MRGRIFQYRSCQTNTYCKIKLTKRDFESDKKAREQNQKIEINKKIK